MADRLDQLLAVRAAEVLPDRVDKELRTRMRGLPVLVHTSGLAATCAFLLSRAGRPSMTDPYYHAAMAMLTTASEAARLPTGADPHTMLDALVRARGHQYLMGETRARELALWLSRLAQARAKGEPDGGGQQ